MTKQELEQYRSIVAELNETGEYHGTLDLRKKRIDEFVNGIENLNVRRMFKERYINGKHQPSFQTIALKMGYADEGTPRKKIKKYLELSENSEIDVL